MISVARLAASAAGVAGVAAASAALAFPAASQPPVTIRLGEYFYKPAVVTVAVGQKVTFLNVGKISHTVADSTKGGRVLSRQIKPHELVPRAGQTVTFSKPGVLYYLCTFHPSLMRGKIVVK